MSMEGGENYENPRFRIEVNVPREQKLAILRLHNGATLQSAAEAPVDLQCKQCVLINYLWT